MFTYGGTVSLGQANNNGFSRNGNLPGNGTNGGIQVNSIELVGNGLVKIT